MASNGCITPSWPPSSSITRISRARILSFTRIRSLCCRKFRSAIIPPRLYKKPARPSRQQLSGKCPARFHPKPPQAELSLRGQAKKYSTPSEPPDKPQFTLAPVAVDPAFLNPSPKRTDFASVRYRTELGTPASINRPFSTRNVILSASVYCLPSRPSGQRTFRPVDQLSP